MFEKDKNCTRSSFIAPYYIRNRIYDGRHVWMNVKRISDYFHEEYIGLLSIPINLHSLGLGLG